MIEEPFKRKISWRKESPPVPKESPPVPPPVPNKSPPVTSLIKPKFTVFKSRKKYATGN